jgi:hypothetical protein
MSNSIFTISPYRLGGALVFDDPAVDLRAEPFVAGADTALDLLAERVLGSRRDRFTVVFSADWFPGSQAAMQRLHPEGGGTWYRFEDAGIDGWLCPALFKYFAVAPERIYLEIRE